MRWEDPEFLCPFSRRVKVFRAKLPDNKADSCVDFSVPLTSQTKVKRKMIIDK